MAESSGERKLNEVDEDDDFDDDYDELIDITKPFKAGSAPRPSYECARNRPLTADPIGSQNACSPTLISGDTEAKFHDPHSSHLSCSPRMNTVTSLGATGLD